MSEHKDPTKSDQDDMNQLAAGELFENDYIVTDVMPEIDGKLAPFQLVARKKRELHFLRVKAYEPKTDDNPSNTIPTTVIDVAKKWLLNRKHGYENIYYDTYIVNLKANLVVVQRNTFTI